MKRLLYYALIVDLIIVDQLSKWVVSEHLIRPVSTPDTPPLTLWNWIVNAPERLSFTSIEALPFFNWVMVWNKGVSFGILNHDSNYGPLFLILMALAVSIWFTIWLTKTENRMQALGLAMVIGGALGNIIDRIRFGAVMDFLDFHIAGFHYPAFNVADSCIVVGVIILMAHALFFDKPLHKDA